MIEDDVGGASKCGGEGKEGERDGGGDGDGGLEEEDEWAGEGRGWGRVEGARIECRSYCGE